MPYVLFVKKSHTMVWANFACVLACTRFKFPLVPSKRVYWAFSCLCWLLSLSQICTICTSSTSLRWPRHKIMGTTKNLVYRLIQLIYAFAHQNLLFASANFASDIAWRRSSLLRASSERVHQSVNCRWSLIRPLWIILNSVYICSASLDGPAVRQGDKKIGLQTHSTVLLHGNL